MISTYYRRTHLRVSLLGILAACGGGGDKATGPSNVVSAVNVSPSSFSMAVGDNTPLTATALNANGNVLSGKTATWSSRASAVATVSSIGVVTGVGVGTATISATIDQKTGSATVTVQQPTANSVTVSPLNPAMVEGDTLPFTATVRDAHGNAIPGKVVTWSTSAPNVATVSTTGLVTAMAAGAATITASADGQNGTSTVSVTAAPSLVLDAGHAVSQSVTSAGGNLTTTVGAVTYKLEIPPGALLTPTMITMTPLTLERHLPANGAFVAGVAFSPTGTRFVKPIRLVVVEHANVPNGQVVVAYSADDQGTLTQLVHSTVTADSLTLGFTHFSVGGWGSFTPGNVPLIPIPQSSAGSAAFESQLAVLDADPNATRNSYSAVFQQWYNTVIGPGLSSASSGTFESAATDFSFWDSRVGVADQQFHFNPTIASTLTTQRTAGTALLPNVLVGAIAARNQSCATTQSLTDAVEVFLMQDIAQQFSVNTSQNGLDAQTVVNGLCVKVMNTQANFPATPQPNQPAQLDLIYGLKFGQNPNLQNNLFKVTLTLTGTTTDGQQLLQTDNAGHLSGAVTPTGSTDFVASMNTCIHPSVGYRLDEVCLTHSVTRQFGTTIAGDVIVSSQVGLTQLANVAHIGGGLTISSAAVTSTDLSELSLLSSVGGSVQISGVTSLHNLNGLSHLHTIGGNLTLSGLTNVTDFSGLSHVPGVQTLFLGSMPQITSLTAFSNMSYTGLNINNMNGLTTLSDLESAPATMSNVQISGNSHLFDMSILHNVVEIDGLFQFFNNPLFTTLNDLAALNKVTGDVTLGGTGLTNGVLLPHLAHIGQSLTVFVNEFDGITSFDLPALVDVGQSITLSQQRQSAGGPASSPLTMHFSALQSINGVISGTNTASKRLFDLSLPSVNATSNFEVFDLLGMRTFAAQTITSAFQLEIDDNPDLVTLALGSVTTTNGGNIEIDDNNALATLTFTQPVHVEGNIEIDNNNAMTSIQFAGGTTGGTMEIDDNAALTSISGAFGLVGTDLEIDHNANLSTASATQWANTVPVGGQREIFANKFP